MTGWHDIATKSTQEDAVALVQQIRKERGGDVEARVAHKSHTVRKYFSSSNRPQLYNKTEWTVQTRNK